MQVRRRPLAGLAVVGAAALIAGCGGGSDSPSADDFREQADAICADANREIDGLTEPASADTDEVLPFLTSGLTIQQSQIDELRDLEPPSDLEGTWNEAIDLLEQRQALIQEAADRIAAGESAAEVLGDDAEIERLQEESRQKARDLGLTVCGCEDEEPSTTAADTTATAPDTATSGPAQSGESARYLADVQAAAGALQSFGQVLQGSTDVDDFKANVPEAQASLDEFDAAIAELDAYELSDARLEEQRSGLAETGPRVSDVLRRFLDAASSGDIAAVGELVPEVTARINEFQQAATGGTPLRAVPRAGRSPPGGISGVSAGARAGRARSGWPRRSPRSGAGPRRRRRSARARPAD